MSAQPSAAPTDETMGEHLESLKAAFSPKDMPCFVGSFAVGAKDLIIYYGKPGPKDTATYVGWALCFDPGLHPSPTADWTSQRSPRTHCIA